MEFKIKNNRRQAIRSLILGVVWIALATLALLFAEDNSLFCGMLPMGLFSLGYFFHLRYRYVFEIKDEVLVIDTFPFVRRRYALADLSGIRYFAGEYILAFGHREIRFDINQMDENRRAEVKDCFEKLRGHVADRLILTA